jgi:hypothetical protein
VHTVTGNNQPLCAGCSVPSLQPILPRAQACSPSQTSRLVQLWTREGVKWQAAAARALAVPALTCDGITGSGTRFVHDLE